MKARIIKVDFNPRAKCLRELEKTRKEEKKYEKIEARIRDNIKRFN